MTHPDLLTLVDEWSRRHEADRVAWLLGAPGAGKTTFACVLMDLAKDWHCFSLADLLAPLPGGGTGRGVATAKRHLVEAIRAIGRHSDRRMLVMATDLAPDGLLPLHPGESITLLQPDRERWLCQLRLRPARPARTATVGEAEVARERLSAWLHQPETDLMTIPLFDELLGRGMDS